LSCRPVNSIVPPSFHRCVVGSEHLVTLDQSLILALEDESRWARKRGLTAKGEVLNFLDYIHLDGLKAVKPEAVRIL
jgi:NitT/TauT family transport system substrate-binding protein